MAGHASASPASSGSHYPSPETYSDMASSNASPASGSPSLYTPRAHDDPDAASPDTRSTEDPAARPPAEVARAHSAGKGGCWYVDHRSRSPRHLMCAFSSSSFSARRTCRLRRKVRPAPRPPSHPRADVLTPPSPARNATKSARARTAHAGRAAGWASTASAGARSGRTG